MYLITTVPLNYSIKMNVKKLCKKENVCDREGEGLKTSKEENLYQRGILDERAKAWHEVSERVINIDSESGGFLIEECSVFNVYFVSKVIRIDRNIFFLFLFLFLFYLKEAQQSVGISHRQMVLERCNHESVALAFTLRHHCTGKVVCVLNVHLFWKTKEYLDVNTLQVN